jgi:hypothetical protein
MISGAQKKIMERQHAKRRAAYQKKETAPKVKFGENAWDHMRVCRHDLESEGTAELPCSFCRMVQMQATKLFAEEERKAAEARAESIVRRGEMRYNLVLNWSKNQTSFYANLAVPNTSVSSAWSVDIGMSRSVSISLEEYATLLDADMQFRLNHAELFVNKEKGEGEDETLNMERINSTLVRRRRIQEVGQYAAVFLQSRIRKMVGRRWVRRVMMQRFEKYHSVDGTSEMLVDVRKGVVDRLPIIIEDIPIKSPRTMGRRINAIEKKRDARSTKFQRYIAKFKNEQRDAKAYYIDFDEIELLKMRHLRNLVSLRDTFAIAMDVVTNYASPPSDASVTTATTTTTLKSSISKGSGSVAANRKSILSKVLKGGGSKGENDEAALTADARGDVDDAATVNTGLEEEGSLAGTSLVSGMKDSVPSVMLGLSAPGPPSRDLGLSIAIRSTTFKYREERGVRSRGKKAEVTTRVLSRMMRQLDVCGWEALRCSSAEEALDKFLLEDLHPPLMSCIAMADDTEEFWASTRKTPVEYAALSPAAREEEERRATHKPKKGERAPHPSMQDHQVLPISIQLRPFPVNKPKNVFRLFFLDQELVAATPMCVWSHYPEIARKKDNIVKELTDWVLTKDVAGFVHSYFVKANEALIMSTPNTAVNLEPARRMIKKQQDEQGLSIKNYTTNFTGGTKAQQKEREKALEAGVGPGVRPMFVPPAEALYDPDIYDDEAHAGSLSHEKVRELNQKYNFLHKSSKFKPLVVKAQNALMAKKKAAPAKPTAAETSGVSDTGFMSWAVTHPSLLNVLQNGGPEIVGEELYELYSQEKYLEGRDSNNNDEASVRTMNFATQGKYYRRFVDLAVNTDISVRDRLKVPKTHSRLVGEHAERQRLLKEAEEQRLKDAEAVMMEGGGDSKGDGKQQEVADAKVGEAEVKLKSASKNGWDSDDEEEGRRERERKEKEKEEAEADVAPTLREHVMNLLVLEVIFPNVSPGGIATTDDFEEGEGEEDSVKDKSTTMGKPVLHQVVGVYNAEREHTGREPGGVDMGLVEWDFILAQSDMAAATRMKHPLEWLAYAAPASWNGTYFSPGEKSGRPWTEPDERGVTVYDTKLKSRKHFNLSIVANPPSKEYLMGELPRNVQRFIGLE